MKSFKTMFAILIACLATGGVAKAQDEAPMMVKSRSGISLDDQVDMYMCSPDGIGVGGFDLVSYRHEGGPTPGDEKYSADLDGITYLFTSQENLDLFLQDPARYTPAYSGFCAITLALGRVTCPEYTNFKIEDDQLLLFEVTGFTNGRTLWNSDTTGFRQQANDNFKRLVELK